MTKDKAKCPECGAEMEKVLDDEWEEGYFLRCPECDQIEPSEFCNCVPLCPECGEKVTVRSLSDGKALVECDNLNCDRDYAWTVPEK